MKPNKSTLIKLLTIITVITISACGNISPKHINNNGTTNSGDNTDKSTETSPKLSNKVSITDVDRIDITDVETFFIKDFKLYTINSKNEIKEAIFLLKDGSKAKIKDYTYFESISDININYIIFKISNTFSQNFYTMNKNNGNFEQTTDFSKNNNEYYPYTNVKTNNNKNSSQFQADSHGNIYFFSIAQLGNKPVRSILKTNLNSQDITPLTPKTEDVYRFTVDSAGNIVYTDSQTYITKVVQQNGSISTLPLSNIACFWTSADGKIYLQTEMNESYVLEFDVNKNIQLTPKGNLLQNIYSYSNTFQLDFYSSITKSIIFNKDYTVDIFSTSTNSSTDNSPLITNLYTVAKFNDYYLMAGNLNGTNHTYICTTGHSCTNITAIPSDYEVLEMVQISNTEVLIKALRQSDQKVVLGKFELVNYSTSFSTFNEDAAEISNIVSLR
jgi:hypothetical protein